MYQAFPDTLEGQASQVIQDSVDTQAQLVQQEHQDFQVIHLLEHQVSVDIVVQQVLLVHLAFLDIPEEVDTVVTLVFPVIVVVLVVQVLVDSVVILGSQAILELV